MKKAWLIAALTLALCSGCSDAEPAVEPEVPAQTDTTQEASAPLSGAVAESKAAKENAQAGEVFEIREKMFLTQINDIYLNIEDYQDMTIRVEGMYSSMEDPSNGKTYSMVYRNGPGCCGNDGWGGFFLNYDGEYPQENDWIAVEGTPELVEDGNYTDLYLNVTSLTVKQERGAEFVEQ